jgi:hypothetical protein
MATSLRMSSKQKKPTRKSSSSAKAGAPAHAAAQAGCEKVWSGKIARLRIYDQPASTGKKVFAYKAPGANADYVGFSDDQNMIKALFLARDNGNAVTGFTNSVCKIEWMDY